MKTESLPAVWRRLGHDRRGAMIPLLSLALVVVVGATAFAVDVGRARALSQSLKSAADAAALAAATRLPDRAAATAAALEYVEKNMPSTEFGRVLDPRDIEVGTWDAKHRRFVADAHGKDDGASAVRVTTRLADANGNAIATFFAGVFGVNSMDAASSSVAGRAGAPCVIALDPTMMYALNLQPNASLVATGCGVQVNSTSGYAVWAAGGASLQAADICVGGAAPVASGSTVSPEPREYCPGVADPLAGLPFPSASGCDFDKASYHKVKATLTPGVYCGGLTIKGGASVTLSPGTYIIRDGAFSIANNASLSGSGVTIFLIGANAEIAFSGGSVVNLTSPTEGDYAGVLIYQDPKSPAKNQWNGTSPSDLRGVIYLPTSALYADGSSSVTPERSCTVLITRELYLGSKASISIDLASTQCRNALPGPYRRGVVLFQ